MVDIISTILTVFLVIISILMIIIILLQSNRAAGGMFGSGAQTAFGAGSADALTKITGGFAAAFLIICFSLAALKSSTRITKAATEQLNQEAATVTPTADKPGAAPAAKPGVPAANATPGAAPTAQQPTAQQPTATAPAAAPAGSAAKPK
jgi:preprotein translocase subunit SecG